MITFIRYLLGLVLLVISGFSMLNAAFPSMFYKDGIKMALTGINNLQKKGYLTPEDQEYRSLLAVVALNIPTTEKKNDFVSKTKQIKLSDQSGYGIPLSASAIFLDSNGHAIASVPVMQLKAAAKDIGKILEQPLLFAMGSLTMIVGYIVLKIQVMKDLF
ncbi:MAG: hypothetical protein HY957_00040 [Nitrospirae bacterium]|nr:hypothetical protein [Nitrospirota bacterium]